MDEKQKRAKKKQEYIIRCITERENRAAIRAMNQVYFSVWEKTRTFDELGIYIDKQKRLIATKHKGEPNGFNKQEHGTYFGWMMGLYRTDTTISIRLDPYIEGGHFKINGVPFLKNKAMATEEALEYFASHGYKAVVNDLEKFAYGHIDETRKSKNPEDVTGYEV